MRFCCGASGLVGLLLKKRRSSSAVDAATIGRRRWSRIDRYAVIERENGDVTAGGAVAVESHDVKLKSSEAASDWLASKVVSIWSASDDVTRGCVSGVRHTLLLRRRAGMACRCLESLAGRD